MKRILAFDCAGKSLSVAIVAVGNERCEVLGELPPTPGENHAATLIPAIEAICGNCGVDIASLDAIALTLGPGAFTAVRIACATAKGFALALDVPLLGVASLEALALNAVEAAETHTPADIYPLMMAGKGFLYSAIYALNTSPEALARTSPRKIPPSACPRESGVVSPPRELLAVVESPSLLTIDTVLARVTRRAVFVGDGARMNRAVIVDTLGERAVFVDDDLVHGGQLGLYASHLLAQGKTLDPPSFAPIYLRPSYAEGFPQREGVHSPL